MASRTVPADSLTLLAPLAGAIPKTLFGIAVAASATDAFAIQCLRLSRRNPRLPAIEHLQGFRNEIAYNILQPLASQHLSFTLVPLFSIQLEQTRPFALQPPDPLSASHLALRIFHRSTRRQTRCPTNAPSPSISKKWPCGPASPPPPSRAS